MQHKSIIIIGTFVIVSTVVIGFLVYYFSRDTFECPLGMYQCRNSMKCILQKNLCDKNNDCPAGDDENFGNCEWLASIDKRSVTERFHPFLRRSKYNLCDVEYCYNNDTKILKNECTYCKYAYWLVGKPFPIQTNEKFPSLTNKTNLTHQHLTEIGNLTNKTEIYWLDLSKNQIRIIKPGQLTELPVLKYFMIEDNEITHANLSDLNESSELIAINLAENKLTYDNISLPCNPRIEFLILAYNSIDRISSGFLSGLPGLRYLDLAANGIRLIDQTAFNNVTELAMLYLENNELVTLADNIFSSLRKLAILKLSYNKIETIKSGQLRGLPALRDIRLRGNRITCANLSDLSESSELSFLDLSGNNLMYDNLNLPCNPRLIILNLAYNLIERISDFPLFCFQRLNWLLLHENRISLIDRTAFINLTELKVLTLANNSIERISDVSSSVSSGLVHLDLAINRISSIDRTAFNNLTKLTMLYLQENELETLPENVFNSLENLIILSIAHNPIKNLSFATLNPLRRIRKIDLTGINMEYIENGAFDIFRDLLTAYLTKFYDCMLYAPNVKYCFPVSDDISSIQHLLEKPVLRYAVWGISAITCLGNMLVLWERFTAKDENRVLSISIKNLAVADILMGIYLIIIAFEDIYFRDVYRRKANSWISSWLCTTTGMLAMISCVVSVSILSFLSTERFILITSPLKNRYGKLNPRTTIISMIIIWVMGITIAIIPIIYWRNSTKYYGINGMCFPLHMDNPFSIGWQYSAFIFICFISFGIFIIAYVYVGMFFSIRKTRRNTTLSIKDSEFVLRFFLIVLTNAACFVPIMILKILSLTNYSVSSDLYGWMVIFVLPVNSAVNPLLYTLTTTRFKERLDKGVGKLWTWLLRKNS